MMHTCSTNSLLFSKLCNLAVFATYLASVLISLHMYSLSESALGPAQAERHDCVYYY